MRIPEKIKIGGHTYICKFDDKLSRDTSANGMSCGNSLEIIIDSSLPEENQESVLLHEILEQINFRYELNLEHEKITILESALYQVLKDNKLNFSDRS
ncbi:hypothetical protein SAMN02745135_01154 [Caloranaerobacter azorensis DSM 13643]|uniref:Uncharacterized protein n=1 Tax=Caloranaerobacter azorensis DSM 13643 TaxID=1121264 RepID=A0A1M5TVA6_9FIRM|nr:hypothetical protein [Caloranaerobacter azorensis]SHH54639.1 hypothetical protein SAMN02745135_01154 [Caloranaerobacter azorensis DSM 13643]